MKILIPNGTSPNNVGDLAILTVLLRLIRRKWKRAQVVLHSTDPQLYGAMSVDRINHTLYSHLVFEDDSFFGRILRMGHFLLFFPMVFFLKSDAMLIFKNSNLIRILLDYIEADLVVFTGGGILRTQKGFTQTLNLFMQLGMLYIAKLSRGTKIIAPMSFGPFAYAWQARVAAFMLKNFDVITTREKYSYALLKKYGVEKVIPSVDLALLLEKYSKKNKRKKIKQSRFIVGITLKNWLPETEQLRFEEIVVLTLKDFAKRRNIAIAPIIQVADSKYGDIDEVVTKRVICQLLSLGIVVLPTKHCNASLRKAMNIYKDLNLLLGMRMHSNIIAATQGVPFVAISYEHKMDGIAHLLGVEEYCISCTVITKHKLLNMLKKAYKKKKSLKSNLKVSLSLFREKEFNTWSEILANPLKIQNSFVKKI